MKKTLLVFVGLAAIFTLAACGGGGSQSSGNNSIVGDWAWDHTGTWYYTFNDDGTGSQFGNIDFTWETSGNELTMTILGTPMVYEFEVSGDALRLISIDFPDLDFTYTRQ